MSGTPSSTTVQVSPERLPGWLDDFAERHGGIEHTASTDTVTLHGPDGTVATCAVPFPPLAARAGAPYSGLVEHATAERTVGVLLVRRGGYAAGVFAGVRLLASKVGSRRVQGRSKAGGWSQKRFARRREEQARAAYAAAADAAAGVLVPRAGELESLVCGGDRVAVKAVLADARFERLRPLAQSRLHAVPDPRQRVLEQFPARFRAVRITVTEPVNQG